MNKLIIFRTIMKKTFVDYHFPTQCIDFHTTLANSKFSFSILDYFNWKSLTRTGRLNHAFIEKSHKFPKFIDFPQNTEEQTLYQYFSRIKNKSMNKNKIIWPFINLGVFIELNCSWTWIASLILILFFNNNFLSISFSSFLSEYIEFAALLQWLQLLSREQAQKLHVLALPRI